MLKNEDLIKWYMNTKIITDLKQINTSRKCMQVKNAVLDEDYDKMVDEYFSLMPFCNLSSETNQITFEESGTNFIKQIFQEEVDDDTLVISTRYEHGSVQDELKKCKHTLLLRYDNDILQKGHTLTSIIDKAKQYKKVFVYIIGTQISTGQITPQSYLIELKEQLIKANIEHKMLLDDVHGMFMVPRDYSIFDYVLYTAHAIIPEFNMGMLISRYGEYGYEAFDWGVEYLPKLRMLLANKVELMQFKTIMSNYFTSILSYPEISLYENTVNHIFALHTDGIYFKDTDYDQLNEYGIVISEHKDRENFMRIRFQEFLLQDLDKALEGLKLAKQILIKAITLTRIKGV